MFIKQLYTACLSEAAYYVESEGEAVIIDPMRDTEPYLDLARERGATIKYILETHFHADFVSGHLELSRQTGAPIVYGPNTRTSYPVTVLNDGDVLPLGSCFLEVLHTPGHTLESTCYLLRDARQKPHAVFTGDTLFVGDVGRPDLSSGSLDSEQLAVMLFHSLQTKIKTLPDDVLVYPAHGPGSSCGKNLGPNTSSTIGEEKHSNYALLADNLQVFVQQVTEGLDRAPAYFPINARINQQGYDEWQTIAERGLKAITVGDLKQRQRIDEDLIILDTRPATVFTEGFIPGSISIGLEGRMAEWAGMLLPFDKDIVLVTEPGKEKESLVRLTRVGLDRVVGYLEGGFDAWKEAGESVDLIIDVEADELAMDLPFDNNLLVLDVRRESEYENGHVEGAMNISLQQMRDPATLSSLLDTDNIYVHCAAGYRSVIAASLMKRQGIHNLRNILGGWKAIQDEKRIPLSIPAGT